MGHRRGRSNYYYFCVRPRQQKLSRHLFTFKNSCHGYCSPSMPFIILIGIYIHLSTPAINTPTHVFLQSFCWFSCSLDKGASIIKSQEGSYWQHHPDPGHRMCESASNICSITQQYLIQKQTGLLFSHSLFHHGGAVYILTLTKGAKMRMELVEMPVEQKQLRLRQKWPTGSSGQKKN